MKKIVISAAAVGTVAILGWFGLVWRDTHPDLVLKQYEIKSLRLSSPETWEAPDASGNAIFIRSKPDEKSALDQFRLSLTIFDDGKGADQAKVIGELRKGYDESEPIRTVRLANGIDAQTWVDWEPMGELNREVRGYAFKAPNGHVYSALQPLVLSSRVNRRYTKLFRDVLGSIDFSAAR